MRKLLLLLVCVPSFAFAQGIDFTRPPAPDWPNLEIVKHYGNITICTQPLGITTIACATPDFKNNKCDVYLPSAPVLRWIVQHEEAHCQGYDHYEDSVMHDAWENYKKDHNEEGEE